MALVGRSFGEASTDVFASVLDLIESVLPPGAVVGSIGLMEDRAGAVRLNVTGLPFGMFADFALASDLHNVPDDAADLFDRLVETMDKITVALDVHLPTDAAPSLALSGFECFIDQAFQADTRWKRLAAIACARCGADAAAMDRVLAAPCRFLPGDPAVRWPDGWLLDALTAPRGRIPSARVWLSHFKLSPGPGGDWRTKAYVAAERTTVAAPDRPAAWPTVPAVLGALEQSREAGLSFLLRRQDQAGLWRDFASPLGAGDEWPSAAIGFCLAGTGAEGRAAASRALAALRRRQRSSGGLGFNAWTPHDADSIAWYLHLARALGSHGGPAEHAARAFLSRHVLPDGGVATYAADTPIRFEGDLEGCDDSGFRAAHPCVSAAASAFLDGSTRSFVARAQAPDGSLPGYWWDEPSYPTALALILADGTPAIDAPRGAAWLSDLPEEGLHPFAAAWRLAGLVAAGCAAHASTGRLAALLVASQREDGSWAGDACMRTPDPWVAAPEPGEGRIDLDVRGLFTTAGAVFALDLLVKARTA